MDHHPQRLRFGLRAKLFLFCLLPVILTLIALMGFSSYKFYRELRQQQLRRLTMQVDELAQRVDQSNREAVTIAQTMAIAQEAGLFGQRELSARYARQVLQKYPQITGAYFGYEPNADGQDAQALTRAQGTSPSGDDAGDALHRRAMDDKGRFLPYWFRDKQDPRKLLLNPLVDMEADSGLYYWRAKEIFNNQTLREKYNITEPYVYEGKMITEQTYPIGIDGKFVGIAGVDRALDDMHAMVQRMARQWDIQLILVSAGGKVISATMDRELETQPISDTPFAQVLEAYYPMADAPAITSQADLDANIRTFVDDEGHRWLFAAAPVRTGQWMVVARVQSTTILQPIWDALRTHALVAAVGVLVLLGLMVSVSSSITHRLQSAVTAAERVASGDLTHDLQINSSDESGLLLRSLQKMTHSLRSLIHRVKQSSVQLMSTATEIAATSRQQENTVTGFGASTSQIAAAVKEISATSLELLETMKEVGTVASQTAELADAGRTGLSDMGKTMDQLASATGSISSKLSVIREKAGDINSVVTTITKVADQTNLLSVNAAIEAEKAGEYGRGFLVVAREIRRLADQTAVATLDIDQMVRQMQGAVSAGVMEMDKFTDEVRRGVAGVAQINAQMSRIIEQVEVLSQRFDAVTEGMMSQSQGAQQISEAMTQLTDGARRTAESLREFNAATEHLRDAVQGLKQEIGSFQTADNHSVS